MAGNSNASVQRSATAEALPDVFGKVLLLISGDVAIPYLQVLVATLRDCARQIAMAGLGPDRLDAIAGPGVRVIDSESDRGSRAPALNAAAAWRLRRLLDAERPDVVHLLGAGPIMAGALALRLAPAGRVMVHVTGPWPSRVGDGDDYRSRMLAKAALWSVASLLRRSSSTLLVECASDLAWLRAEGIAPGPRFAILGGPGVDPRSFEAMPPPSHAMVVAACIGRMNKSDGVDVLFQACDRVAGRGQALGLELGADGVGVDAQTAAELAAACQQRRGRWLGQVADARDVWRNADICVLPALNGVGVPRALLEAAACARPLVVTDVPGCRDFVRDGVEGFLVPAGNAAALADALQRLAIDPEQRERMGEAARLRLLHGFTDAHVRQALRGAYQAMLGLPGR